MRFLRISTTSFGALQELDTGPDALPRLVVVEGRNEAGKSTFFELLATILYGFYPASRESHPYAPWSGAVADTRATLELRDGSEREVHRRLLATPQGTLVMGEVEEDLRNRTLPFVEHVPRKVFRHVFALTLGELAGLEGESWERVQDRLMGAMGATDLRSARDVVEELEADAGRLWRTTRRGSQEVRDLEERMRQLRTRRREAVTQEDAIRRISDELSQARDELDRAREEREACRLYIERYRGLLPIREQLLRVEGLQKDAGDPTLLEGLPPDPEARLAELREQLDELGERLRETERAADASRETLDAFREQDLRLLEREREVETLVTRHAALEPTRVRVAHLEQELRDFRRRIDTLGRRLLGREIDTKLNGPLMDVPVTRLEELVREVEAARQSLDGLSQSRRQDPSPPTVPAPLWLPVSALAVGVLGLLGGSMVESIALSLVGAIAVGVATVLLYLWSRSRAQLAAHHRDREARAADLARLRTEREGELETARRKLTALLGPLEPGPDAPSPGSDFPAQFERLQDLVRDEGDRRRSMESGRREIDATQAEAEALRRFLPQDDRDVDAAALAQVLSRSLRAAGARREAASGAERELARLAKEMERTRELEASARSELSTLTDRLTRLGGGDLEGGIRSAEARLFAVHRSRQILDELELAHPRLDEIRARIREAEEAGEDWAVDPEALAQRRAREEAVSGQIEELLRSIQAMEKDLEHLSGRTTLDDLDGEILELEERIERVTAQRDRLWILGRIVREAERRIREEHQPEILRLAGDRLARLTGGRYDRLLLAGRDGRDFRVSGPATPSSLPIDSPLSAGTREQIYLALRLSTLDQLDRAGERLPVLLDEVLVNWDPVRREAGLELLAEVARERQCFFFTCHPPLAERLEQLGGSRIQLDAP